MEWLTFISSFIASCIPALATIYINKNQLKINEQNNQQQLKLNEQSNNHQVALKKLEYVNITKQKYLDDYFDKLFTYLNDKSSKNLFNYKKSMYTLYPYLSSSSCYHLDKINILIKQEKFDNLDDSIDFLIDELKNENSSKK